MTDAIPLRALYEAAPRPLVALASEYPPGHSPARGGGRAADLGRAARGDMRAARREDFHKALAHDTQRGTEPCVYESSD